MCLVSWFVADTSSWGHRGPTASPRGEGAEYDRVRTWLIDELERRSPAAERAAEKLFEGEYTADQYAYARTVAAAARADVRAGRA